MSQVNKILEKGRVFPLEVEEMAYVVEQYIKDRKGENVNINIMKDLNPGSVFFFHNYRKEVSKLINAYNIAEGYFLNKQNHEG